LLKHSRNTAVNRIIDANVNRLKEGLRVCEEIARFTLNSRTLTAQFKNIRHSIDAIVKRLPVSCFQRLEARCSISDVGKEVYGKELKRTGLNDIFFANIQRVKESIRVLEEFSKLIDTKSALKFKTIRYEIYSLEKKVVRQI